MYSQVNPENKRELESQTIVQFLMNSGLEVQKLKYVWQIAAQTSNSFLLKEEFYIAMRLVAYIQNDIPANENSIRMNIAAPLPRFDDYKPTTPGADPSFSAGQSKPAGGMMGQGGGAQGAAGGINVESLPDLKDLDFTSPST